MDVAEERFVEDKGRDIDSFKHYNHAYACMYSVQLFTHSWHLTPMPRQVLSLVVQN